MFEPGGNFTFNTVNMTLECDRNHIFKMTPFQMSIIYMTISLPLL